MKTKKSDSSQEIRSQKVELPPDQRTSTGAILYASTAPKLQKKIDAYMWEYHPIGYGTRISREITQHKDGYFFCELSRYSSCD